MRTRSSSNLVSESSPNPTTSNPKRRNRRRSKQPFILEESPIATMADQHTMAELLRASTEGYAEAIVVPSILAEHFELKHSLINMMTSDQFFGLEKDNPHYHIRWFNKITSIIKYKDVPNSAIKLMLFPFSLAGAARRWLNLLHACPHHGFTELHQLDTFYNASNPTDQDSLNSAAGGNLLERSTRDVICTIIENKSKVRNSRIKSIASQVKSSDVNSSSPSEIAKLTHGVNQQTSDVTTVITAILKQFQATPPHLPYSTQPLADLGASINLMPLSVWKKLGLPELISTQMTLELANREICTPVGIARDVFVPVGKFTFPADFVIVDYESDPRVPLILGRPFLRTARALIDVHGEEMILRDGNERLTLNMRHDTSSYSTQPHQESINMIDVYNVSHEEILKDLFATNHPSGNPTSSLTSHTDLTSPEEEKIKDSKILIDELDLPGSSDFLPSPECDLVFYEDFSKVDALPSTKNEDKVFNPGILIHENHFGVTIRVTPDKNVKKLSNASLILEDFNPPLYELPFHKEVPRIAWIFEASRARGFVLHSLELQITSFILGIQYLNLID
ncbi:reverse transcriptase domain-containing protein [Tanacetum coccineum]|uniref:Reverse transcriptase domain-containing protein n=1 Tax=Tanacetum coccineum TaxID=301880 RepID=A0ABQ4WB30_9ASTR